MKMEHRIKKVALMMALLTVAISISMAAPKTAAAYNPEQEKGEERGKAQDSEKKVKMKDLPPAVQDTVRQQSKGATIRGLAQETEDGVMNYEVELKVGGHNKDVLIDPTGVVVEIEEQVTLDSLPPAVKTTVMQNAGKGKIGMIESITKGNIVVAYEAHIRKAGKSVEIKVAPDGQLMP
jgi:uncharacterized membrane protein YkoI